MVKKIRLGLKYSYDENWIGGTYYLENLVKSFNTLDDDEKPEIVAIVNKKSDFLQLKKNTNYPHLKFQIHSGEKNIFHRAVNIITRKLIKKSIFSQQIENLDAIFPYTNSVQFALAKKKIYWIPDFQDHFFSQMFSDEELEKRKAWQKDIVYSKLDLVLSSKDAFNNLSHIFPDYTVSPHVIPFAVTIPQITNRSIPVEINQYQIPQKYFICCNQFWPHKNHLTVLKAINHLKKKGEEIKVIFTGKVSPHTQSNIYYEGLLNYIKLNKLSDNILLLGFVDRELQINLLLNAQAVVQPSLFEGWSTIVEDSKSLGKRLIVSNLEIHKEQLNNYKSFYFDPNDELDLARCLSLVNLENHVLQNTSLDYNKNIAAFAKKFTSILNT